MEAGPALGEEQDDGRCDDQKGGNGGDAGVHAHLHRGEDQDRQREVARACEEDAWPQPVIDCVASTPHPQDCLERLDDKRRLGYEKRLQAWSDEFSEGDGLFSGAAVAPPIACEDVIGSGEGFRSSATITPWAEKQRRDVLVEECEHHWSDSVKRCVEAAGAPGPAWSCLKDELSQDEVDEYWPVLWPILTDSGGYELHVSKKQREAMERDDLWLPDNIISRVVNL